MNDFKGFGLFSDVDDKKAQTSNRARMLLNIVEDNQSKGKFNMKAVALSTGYIRSIPPEDQRAVLNEFVEQMKKKGYELTNTVQAQKEIDKYGRA